MIRVNRKNPPVYVCPDCNQIVGRPKAHNGFLRCDQGHRVQALTKSTLDEAAASAAVALCSSGFLIGVGNAISGNATGSAAFVSLLMLGWAVFLFWRGMKCRTVPAPARLLVKQYTASGTAFLSIGGLILAGAAAGLFRR
jgi:hypothetical protein